MKYLKPILLIPLTTLSSDKLLKLEDVIVTETRQEIELKTAPSAITSISEEDLNTRGKQNLRDLLIFDSSLFILRSRGTDFIGIRGFTQGRVLILIDGRRLSGEVDRTFELERITLDKVERIEVLKGPASVLYGTDALGGVINVITKEPDKREFSYTIRYGFPPEERQISLSGNTGSLGAFNIVHTSV